MKRSYKFRLYPTRKQIEKLEKALQLCRHLYNNCLEERIELHEKHGKTITFYEQRKFFISSKESMPEYKEIYCHTLDEAIRRLDRAYLSFFRRVKKGEGKAGFPRFKSASRYRSLDYDSFGFRIRESGRLYLSKIGEIRMFKHQEIEGKVKTCIVKKDRVGDWFATICVELPDIEKPEPKTAIGVDVGLKYLITCSDGEQIKPHKALIKSENNIKKTDRGYARKKKGSNNRKKAVIKLAKAHRKIKRQRDDYLHKVSKELSKKADVIVFEDLSINDMMQNSFFAKSIVDASWGKLIQYTSYKVEETGGEVVLVDPMNTSQLCSQCGAMVKKSLSVRLHSCTTCGFVADRDLNASFNILKRLPTGCGKLLQIIKMPVESSPLASSSGGVK